jgi:RNA polymerase sigma factor (TIGR02999 family)
MKLHCFRLTFASGSHFLGTNDARGATVAFPEIVMSNNSSSLVLQVERGAPRPKSGDGLMGESAESVTQILEAIGAGDQRAAEELLPLVYEELRRLAAARMAEQPPGQTLQATALVHEAWLKLAGNTQACWNGRKHFFRAAAEAMRQILIDRACSKRRLKRGDNAVRANPDDVDLAIDAEPEALLLVDEALELLAREALNKAELVKLRFYAGLSVEESAQALIISCPFVTPL